MTAPIALGSRRELFVDHFLIEHFDGTALHLHPPIRREVVYQVSQPWDNACTGCYNLTQDGDRILLYYRGFYPIGADYADGAASQTTNLAVSTDGIHFTQPELGLVEFNGTRKNNVLIQGHESHNFCVFLDANPDAAPEQRFKAVGGTGRSNLHGFASPDGLRWTPVKEGPLEVTGAFDSLNVPLWDPHVGRYRLFSRYSESAGGARVRAIQSCTSEDFVHWTDPEPPPVRRRRAPGALLHQRHHAVPRRRAHPPLLPHALPARARARHRGHAPTRATASPTPSS